MNHSDQPQYLRMDYGRRNMPGALDRFERSLSWG